MTSPRAAAPRLAPLLAAAAAALLAAAPAWAQERGRTDGPEGSEVGKGGYDKPSGDGAIGFSLRWGGVAQTDATLLGTTSGAPLTAGASLSYYVIDWFQLDLSGDYLFYSKRFDVLVGPRFRTATWPVSASLGVKAGMITFPDGGSVKFGLSPQLGVDVLVTRKITVGLGYAIDIPVGVDAVAHRLFLEAGMRF